MKYLLAILITCFTLAAKAENYSIDLKGSELGSIAALEIKLAFEPKDAFVLGESFEVSCMQPDKSTICKSLDNEILYKVVDPRYSLIRLFFSRPVKASNLSIKGDLIRSNFTGDAKVNIAKLNLIPDFAHVVNSSKIKSKISLYQDEEPLPFLGISKAEILGPQKRILFDDLLVAVGNIETYGFSLDQSISSVKINGQAAEIINDEIIMAHLDLDSKDIKEGYEVLLELEVDKKKISKNVGTLDLVEAIK